MKRLEPCITGEGTAAAVAELSPAPATSSFSLRVPTLPSQRFVKAVLSPRARGLSLELNINPERNCNFDCCYCYVDRLAPLAEPVLNLDVIAEELVEALLVLHSTTGNGSTGALHVLPLRNVALTGDGEPTLAPQFEEAVQMVAHVRATRSARFFKIVLVTNATGLALPGVQRGLRYLNSEDEIWAKLDAGTQAYLEKVNRTAVPLQYILANILETGRRRPLIIQSLFSALEGEPPSAEEIQEYAQRLNELREGGAQIQSVQIYSATGRTSSHCEHLPLATLSRIANIVREVTGLRAEVF